MYQNADRLRHIVKLQPPDPFMVWVLRFASVQQVITLLIINATVNERVIITWCEQQAKSICFSRSLF